MDADAAKGGTGDEGDAAAELADDGGESTDSTGPDTGLRDRIMPEPYKRERESRVEKKKTREERISIVPLHSDQS